MFACVCHGNAERNCVEKDETGCMHECSIHVQSNTYMTQMYITYVIFVLHIHVENYAIGRPASGGALEPPRATRSQPESGGARRRSALARSCTTQHLQYTTCFFDTQHLGIRIIFFYYTIFLNSQHLFLIHNIFYFSTQHVVWCVGQFHETTCFPRFFSVEPGEAWIWRGSTQFAGELGVFAARKGCKNGHLRCVVTISGRFSGEKQIGLSRLHSIFWKKMGLSRLNPIFCKEKWLSRLKRGEGHKSKRGTNSTEFVYL